MRLIVVDSISSPFRETDATQRSGLADRTGMLSRTSALLKEYAHRHDVAVVGSLVHVERNRFEPLEL